MTLPAALAAFCENLHATLGVPVSQGWPPEAATPGVYVWPWRLEEMPVAASLRHGAPSPTPPSLAVHLLVLAEPAALPEGLAWLAQARQALHAQPLLQLDGRAVQVLPDPLTLEQLTALFTAARQPLRLCLAVVLRGA